MAPSKPIYFLLFENESINHEVKPESNLQENQENFKDNHKYLPFTIPKKISTPNDIWNY
jgi:hypothetical protein